GAMLPDSGGIAPFSQQKFSFHSQTVYFSLAISEPYLPCELTRRVASICRCGRFCIGRLGRSCSQCGAVIRACSRARNPSPCTGAGASPAYPCRGWPLPLAAGAEPRGPRCSLPPEVPG